jgi:2-C-methyl-D-erythritol 4-phosphate cytidylyltransferase
MKTVAVIVAGGKGKRMGRRKQFLKIAGKTILQWTVAAFDQTGVIDGIVLVVAKEQLRLARKIKSKKLISIVEGGKERFDSVRNGLAALPPSVEMVAIHDGARPAVTPKIIEAAVSEANRTGAAVAGFPLKDTIKKVERRKLSVERSLDRAELWAAQTPQVFKISIIQRAYQHIRGDETDDAMLVERMGIPVKMVMGTYKNLKVTQPEDLIIAAAILKKRRK